MTPHQYIETDLAPGETLTDYRHRKNAERKTATVTKNRSRIYIEDALLLAAAVFAVAVILLCTGALGDNLAHAHKGGPVGKPVALTDASYPPSYLKLVWPGQSATPRDALRDREQGRPCKNPSTGKRGYFSDVSAYHWDGSALAGQRWDHDLPGWYWKPRGSRSAVGYDGLNFLNGLSYPVLVAGWCDEDPVVN